MKTLKSGGQLQSEQSRLVNEIFAAVATIEARACTAAWPPDEETLSAEVRFSGAWSGAMTLACSMPLAFSFTSKFMSIPLPQKFDEDVCDALAELVNVVAGNFKALLPSGSVLSIPIVVRTSAETKGSVEFETISRTAFQTSDGRCWLEFARAR